MIKKYCLLFLIFFSSLSFSQIEEIANIFTVQLGLTVESVKEKCEQNNIFHYSDLVSETDDLLKYESNRDSGLFGCIFYFVEDSLYSFSIWIKTTFEKTQQLLGLTDNNFGKPDSITAEPMNDGKECKTLSWVIKNSINNSVDNISLSYKLPEKNLCIVNFSKYNTLLNKKAILLKKHHIEL